MGENTFDVIMENCPFLKSVIEQKIAEEVAARDAKIAELESVTEELTVTILMGGM
jgi:hypothetical protein